MRKNKFKTNRREFLQVSIAVAAAAALPTTVRAAATAPAAAQIKRATDIIEVGPEKVKMTRMAVGTGTVGGGFSSNQLRKRGVQGVAEMWMYAYENGITTWDTSDGYGTHPAIKIAMKTLNIPREKITILTKTGIFNDGAKLKSDLEQFKLDMGVDYIDIILLHSRVAADWETQDKALMDVLSEAKQKKIVRTVGVSIHSLDVMKAAIKSKWFETGLVRINPAGIRMDATPEEVLPLMQQMKDAGKGVIGMKVLGEGQLKDRADEAIQFALNKSPAHCFTIGCESKEEVKENIDRIAKLAVKA